MTVNYTTANISNFFFAFSRSLTYSVWDISDRKPRLHVAVNLLAGADGIAPTLRDSAAVRRRLRRRAHAPRSNTASHDNHDNINGGVSFAFLNRYAAPLSDPSGRQSSTVMKRRQTLCIYCCGITEEKSVSFTRNN